MKKTKYQPKAGDVCEWFNRWTGKMVQMMIVSPEPTERGFYLALDNYDLDNDNYVHWFMFIDELKLIYRP